MAWQSVGGIDGEFYVNHYVEDDDSKNELHFAQLNGSQELTFHYEATGYSSLSTGEHEIWFYVDGVEVYHRTFDVAQSTNTISDTITESGEKFVLATENEDDGTDYIDVDLTSYTE